jgi:hypothetical protein
VRTWRPTHVNVNRTANPIDPASDPPGVLAVILVLLALVAVALLVNNSSKVMHRCPDGSYAEVCENGGGSP